MKIRIGFVSNSSSSSFIIKKKNLTPFQIELIKNHIEVAKIIDKQIDKVYDYLEEERGQFDKFHYDEWEIEETDEQIRGDTSMDNFDMLSYLELIGINLDNVKFDGDNHWSVDDVDDWWLK